MSSAPLYLGIDLGGTKVLALVGTSDGRSLGDAVVPTPADQGPQRVVEAMVEAVAQAASAARVGLSALHGAGVAAAGAIDQDRGLIIHSPHLIGWDHVPLAEMLRQRLDLPTVLGNDANMAALAEHRFGAGRGFSHLLYITVSTGIGGGIIIGGQLYQGGLGLAGEVGHISVLAEGPYGRSHTAGALEALASGTALAWEATRRLQEGEPSLLQSLVQEGSAGTVTAQRVFEALREGDELARQVVDGGIRYLGAGLTSLVNVLNPQVLIIGGGLSKEWEEYIQPAVALMREQAFAGMGRDLPVVPPLLGDNAGALGAVALAMASAKAETT